MFSLRALLVGVLLTLPLAAQETVRPEVLGGVEARSDPQRWTGLVLRTSTGIAGVVGRASGVVVQPHVYATAAHVVFNEESGEWDPAGSIRIAPSHHTTLVTASTGRATVATVRFASYRTRSNADRGPAGTSSLDTFNLDFAVGYVTSPLMVDRSYAPVFVEAEEGVSVLREKRAQRIVGYPADREQINSSRVGLMHGTPWAQNDAVYWDGRHFFPETHRDSEQRWVRTHTLDGVRTFGGNSGGPIMVRDDDGVALVAGLVVSGSSVARSGVRTIDPAAWALIRTAEAAVSDYALARPTLEASSLGQREVAVSWTSAGKDATGYLLERREAGAFDWRVELSGEALSYLDTTVVPGRSYTYRVRAVDRDGQRSPPSVPQRVQTRGFDKAVAEALGVPGLGFTVGGDVGYLTGPEGIRSGLTQSMQNGFVELKLIGPGVLAFDWRVSSEDNDGYDDPSDPYYREIYDAFYFHQNGVQLDFLSGEIPWRTKTLAVPAGEQTFRWEYRKDPYTNEGEDAGFLRQLQWTPQGRATYFYGAQEAGNGFQVAPWFGFYTTAALPWSFTLEHGWLYLERVSAREVWAYDPHPEVGWMYLSPAFYPYVYTPRWGWAFYYEGTGTGGGGRYFYLTAEARDLFISAP